MLTRSRLWKWDALRDNGYHLVFRSASYGVFLTAVLTLVMAPFWSRVPEAWLQCAMRAGGLDDPPSLLQTAAVAAMILGFAFPYATNFLVDQDKAAGKAAHSRGDLIEAVLYESRAMAETVEIVLCNGKTYIGYALECGVFRRDDSDPDISLLPVVSGYRTRDKQELRIEVDYYDKVYSRDPGARPSGIALPLKDIRSARRFDLKLYAEAQADDS